MIEEYWVDYRDWRWCVVTSDGDVVGIQAETEAQAQQLCAALNEAYERGYKWGLETTWDEAHER